MRFLNQMGEDFGVGLGAEYVAALGEGLPQRSGVFDDAVVHHGEGAAAVRMRMGIDGVRGAVRRPARVRDRGRAFGQLTAKLALERGDLSGCAEYFEPAVDDGQTCRVVPAILETLQPLQHDGRRRPFADVPYDAAHNRSDRATPAAVRPVYPRQRRESGVATPHTAGRASLAPDSWLPTPVLPSRSCSVARAQPVHSP